MERVQAASSSLISGVTRPLIREEEKQTVHEQWWLMTAFAAILPLGMSLAISMKPLERMLMKDSIWDPPFSKQDISLLDGAMIAPSVIMPVLTGLAMDIVWSANLTLLSCLIGSVMGAFFVAMGFAWHSFGLALTGRVISGFCFGSLLVVCDVIAVQFNRRRKAVTLACVSAGKTFGIYLNSCWMENFTQDKLGGDHEKMNDILLISTLLCLGVGFLWSPLTSSLNLEDSVKMRRAPWKWHIGKSVWALALCSMILGLFTANTFFNTESRSSTALLVSAIALAPLLGYWMDYTDRSQNGSSGILALLIGFTWLILIGQMLFYIMQVEIGLTGIALGVMPMLIRVAVPQVAKRDNLGTSFGIIEGLSFLTAVSVGDSSQPNFLNQLVLLAVTLFLLTFVSYKVDEKWSRVMPSPEPVQVRGA